jgi:hypothetical protein
MAALTTPWQPTNRSLRQAGWLVAGVLALIGHLLAPSVATLVLQLSGAAVFAVATVKPRALRPLYLVTVWPVLWLGLRLARPFLRPGLAAELAETTARRLRSRRRLQQP